MGAKAGALRAAFGLSYRLGGPRVWDLVRGGRTKILMYHGIPAREQFDGIANHYGYNIPVRQFADHMEYLARRCQVITLADFRRGEKLSRSKTNVIITFDDGYLNNYTQAFPVLRRLGLPAICALPTAFVVDGEPLWNDVIEHVVNRSRVARVTLPGADGERTFELAAPGQRLKLYAFLLRECVRGDMEHRRRMTATAIERLEVPGDAEAVFEDEDYRPMSREHIGEMAASGLIEFASHSIHHFLLARVDRQRKREELAESRRLVAELSGAPCPTFCVPGGSYDDEVLEEAFGAGYESVLTSDEGTALPGSRVLRRFGMFRFHDLQRFADLIHGPVHPMIGVAQRVRGKAKALFRAGAAS